MNDQNDDQLERDADEEFEIGIRIDGSQEDDSVLAEMAVEEPHEVWESGNLSESADGILPTLHDLGRKLEHLSAEFESKLKCDEHKNRIIDDLHRELQVHREGVIKKHLHSVMSDIIKIIDDIRKFKFHWESQSPTAETTANLLDFMDQIASDLEDLFSWQGIVAFTCDQNTFDSTRQRIIKKIETLDPGKNKTVAQSLRPGYVWDGKIIRPEMVSIYVYNEEHTKEQTD